MEQIETLKELLTGTDLEKYKENIVQLQFALSWAESEILKRRNTDKLENKYLVNKIQGAVYYLSKIGAEGASSVGENGVSISWEEVPKWLLSVVPKLGVVK